MPITFFVLCIFCDLWKRLGERMLCMIALRSYIMCGCSPGSCIHLPVGHSTDSIHWHRQCRLMFRTHTRKWMFLLVAWAKHDDGMLRNNMANNCSDDNDKPFSEHKLWSWNKEGRMKGGERAGRESHSKPLNKQRSKEFLKYLKCSYQMPSHRLLLSNEEKSMCFSCFRCRCYCCCRPMEPCTRSNCYPFGFKFCFVYFYVTSIVRLCGIKCKYILAVCSYRLECWRYSAMAFHSQYLDGII